MPTEDEDDRDEEEDEEGDEDDEDDDEEGAEDAEEDEDEEGAKDAGDEDEDDEDGGGKSARAARSARPARSARAGKSGRSNERSFDEETEGVIVAGRPIEISGMKRRDLGRLAEAVEAIGKRAGLALKLTPGGDNSTESGPSDEADVYCVAVAGFEAARGGGFDPEPVDRAKMLQKLEEARKIPAEVWSEIAALLPPSARRHFDQTPDVSLHIACVGPLSAASLIYGILGERDDAIRPGKFHRGQDMNQEPHGTGVWGVRAAFSQYEGPDVDELDLGDEEHQDRVKRLGPAEGAGYYLIARYD